MIEAFGPAEAIEDAVHFTDFDKATIREIITRTKHNLKEQKSLTEMKMPVGGRYRAVISKEGLIPENHQAAVVGTKVKIDPAVKRYLRAAFMEKGWDEMQVVEDEDEIEIILNFKV